MVQTNDHPNGPANTDVIAGAEHIHFHHKLSDQFVIASPKHPGRCAVEMVCHACHASALVFFTMPPNSQVPINYEKVHKTRDDFMRRHGGCRGIDGKDYRKFCPVARTTKPAVFDFSRATS